jgi:lysophospholipase L1-like esterase
MFYIKQMFIAFLLIFSSQSFAMQTWILMGDSILSAVSPTQINGKHDNSNKLAAFHLMNESNVSIRNISSPGISLGHSNLTGWNNRNKVTDTLGTIGGAWSAYNGIIIQAGTNDFGRSVHWRDTVTSLRYILNHAKALNKKVMVMEPIWRRNEQVQNNLGFTLDTYRFFMYIVCVNEFPETCHYAFRNNSPLVDSRASKYFDGSEIKSQNELHLNAAGHRAYADWIKFEAARKGWF